MQEAYQHLTDLIQSRAQPISLSQGFDQVLAEIGDARFVLMGEATHGTAEFYQARIEISKKLIQEKGFIAIGMESDLPETYRLHCYIQNRGEAATAESALQYFTRFPRWMWCNQAMPPFLDWLRQFNVENPDAKISLFGLDIYSFYRSMEAVIEYLEKIDPPAAQRAKIRYACFDQMNEDPHTYGYLTKMGIKKKCIIETLEQVFDLQFKAWEYLKQNDHEAEEEYFYALQNAKLVKNAENYYRSIFEGHTSSWNNRDKHMWEVFNHQVDFLERRLQQPAKMIIWAHNSHVGDARATEMGESGEFNIGELIRKQYPDEVYSLGFSTYSGAVTAASEWGGEAETKIIVPGLSGSYESVFHDVGTPAFFLPLAQDKALTHYLHLPRLQRAIGVIYKPETERESHYFFTKLMQQFDGIIHFDKTHAIQPLM